MASPHLTSLIHLAGFGTGTVLYAMLVAMTSRDASSARERGASVTSLPLSAALLGLVWNLGGLVIYGLRDFGIAQPPPRLVAVAFAALGFLPAVVVHSAMAGARGWRQGPVLLAYALSAAAAVFFIVGGGDASLPSRTALLTLTVGYLALVALVAMGIGRDAARGRSVTMVALAAFAASALHLSHDVAQPDSWFVALVGHHASIPLVLVILYQDYRFAFADLFLRRAISVSVLVAIAVVLHVTVATPLMSTLQEGNGESLLATAGHIALWVGTALAYPVIYRATSHFVDSVILRRGDYAALRRDVAFATSRAETEEEAAEEASRIVAAAFGMAVQRGRWRMTNDALPAHARVDLPSGRRDEAQVLVPTNEPPSLVLSIGPLPAGRRLLSDEVTLLEAIATVLGRRIDVLRVSRERFERDLREREITQLAAESELRALRAQLNPHFLFNALTTLGYLMQAAPERALGTLYRLTELLRAVLRGPAGDAVTLGEELDIIEAYLAIERERFQERLTVTIDVPEALRGVRIPPLLLQPLVENAVKHGITPLRRGGTITVTARVVRGVRTTASSLEIKVADTGAGLGSPSVGAPGEGMGLMSIERRLDRLYGAGAHFAIVGAPDRGTTATISLPLEPGQADELGTMTDDREFRTAG
ncbi:MAG: histidine kinase [Cytophagaceae bacterium]|nr:histidine kinase [Gemmatimonadaceae bacterium]